MTVTTTVAAGTTLAPPPKPRRNDALDGLRGFALLGMLAWHAEVGWMRGGFARMTIFFVLSGFLAAQSYGRIRDRQRSGAFTTFWLRRARRLLPTTLLGVALAILVTVAVGTVDARRDLFGDVAATLANVANWRFIAEGRPYGALFERPSSLQHYWSLAVEEQCFWLLPPVLALFGLGIDRLSGAARSARRVRQRRLVLGLAVLLGLIPVVFDLDPDTVYYGTHVRGAEFAVGMWLGLWLMPGVNGAPVASRVRALKIAGPIGLAVLVVVMLTVDRNLDWLYQGGLGLFAIPAAAAVGGAVVAAPGLTLILSAQVLRLPGRWALSVYALHWPLFQLIDNWFGDWPAALLVVLKFSTALIVGAAAYRWYEQPLSLSQPRSRAGSGLSADALAMWWRNDRVALSAFGASAVVLLLAASMVHRPAPVIDFEGAREAAERRSASVPPPTVSTPVSGQPGSSTPAAEAPQRVGVFGSSSGLLLGFTMGDWVATHPGWVDVGGDTPLGCGFLTAGLRAEPISDRPDGDLRFPGPECNWRVAWVAALARNPATMAIVVPGRWDATDWRAADGEGFTSIAEPRFASLVLSEIGAAIDLLHNERVERIVLVTVPRTGNGQSGTIVEDRQFPGDDPQRIAIYNGLLRQVAAERPFVRIVDLATWADALPPERHAEVFPDGIHTDTEHGPQVWSEFLGPTIDDLNWDS